MPRSEALKSRESSQIFKARNEYWSFGARTGDSMEAFQQWWHELEDARRRFTLEQPLQAGKVFTVQVVTPLSLSDQHSRRILPACTQTPGELETTLIEPLLGSTRGDGHVWRVKTAAGDHVVAKFYIPSSFIPDKQHHPSMNDFILPRQGALVEEIAYGILRSAQGRWLPYFLGRTEVCWIDVT